MCGICGIIDFAGATVHRETIQGMADSLWHRGPDDAGYHFEPGVGLGHRRLSIIDLNTERSRYRMKMERSGLPIAEWFRGGLREWAEESMFTSDELLNIPYLRRLWDRHKSRTQDHSAILWAVCMFRQWQKTFQRQPEASSGRVRAFT